MALEPFVSSKYGRGHSGLGLYFASELARFAKGTFMISSGGHSISIFGDQRSRQIHPSWHGTVVSVLLDTSHEISSQQIWAQIPSDGEESVAKYNEHFPPGASAYSLAEGGGLLFTRDSAKRALSDFKTRFENASLIVVSLEGVDVATPSYLDEFFRTLLRDWGLAEFQRRVRIIGSSEYHRVLTELVLHNELRYSSWRSV